MRFSILLILLCIFSIFLIKVNEAHFYAPMIKGIYDKFKTSGVVIASGIDRLSFQRQTIWHETFRFLSHEGISTVILNYRQLQNTELVSRMSNTHYSLIVIVLETIEELHSFELIAESVATKYAIGMLVFTDDGHQEICDFCRHPHGVLTSLMLHWKVVISCCSSNIIEEWLSIGKIFPKRHEIGRLIEENLTISWYQEELNNKIYSLNGVSLRIVAVKQSVFYQVKNGENSGFVGELITQLSQLINFTISEIIWEDEFGVCNAKTSHCTGAIGRVHRREADLGVSAFTMTPLRRNSVDFTVPIFTGNSQIHFNKYGAVTLKWNAYLKVFTVHVWIGIVILIMTTPMFFTLVEYKPGSPFFSLLIDHYLQIWGIYCHQALPAFPTKTSLRITYVTLALSAVTISNSFGAGLISELTLAFYIPFTTVEEFVKDGTYELIVLDRDLVQNVFTFSDEKLQKKFMSLLRSEDLIPNNVQEAFEQICTERLAFYSHEATKKALSNLIPCEIASISTDSVDPMSLITPQGSQCTKYFNYYINRFKTSGLLQRLENKYFRKLKNDQREPFSIDIQAVKLVLLIFTVGCCIAIIIFIIEFKLYKNLQLGRNQKKRKTVLKNGKKFPVLRLSYLP